jgi:hypothetical protein
VDKDDAAGGCLAPETNHPPSLAERSLRRHTPKVGAVCGKAARTVLCGGRAMKRASLPLHRPTSALGTRVNINLGFRNRRSRLRANRRLVHAAARSAGGRFQSRSDFEPGGRPAYCGRPFIQAVYRRITTGADPFAAQEMMPSGLASLGMALQSNRRRQVRFPCARAARAGIE